MGHPESFIYEIIRAGVHEIIIIGMPSIWFEIFRIAEHTKPIFAILGLCGAVVCLY